MIFSSVIRIKKIIKRYLKAHRRGYFKDLSSFKIKYNDITNIEELIEDIEDDLDDLNSSGKDFYNLLTKFYQKLNFRKILENRKVYTKYFGYKQPINESDGEYEYSDDDDDYVSDSDSDSDSDQKNELKIYCLII